MNKIFQKILTKSIVFYERMIFWNKIFKNEKYFSKQGFF